MEHVNHPFSELFEQLGLPEDSASIQAFIETHSPLSEEIALADAPFWNSGQAAFLRDAWEEDADWAETADQLNVALRKS